MNNKFYFSIKYPEKNTSGDVYFKLAEYNPRTERFVPLNEFNSKIVFESSSNDIKNYESSLITVNNKTPSSGTTFKLPKGKVFEAIFLDDFYPLSEEDLRKQLKGGIQLYSGINANLLIIFASENEYYHAIQINVSDFNYIKKDNKLMIASERNTETKQYLDRYKIQKTDIFPSISINYHHPHYRTRFFYQQTSLPDKKEKFSLLSEGKLIHQLVNEIIKREQNKLMGVEVDRQLILQLLDEILNESKYMVEWRELFDNEINAETLENKITNVVKTQRSYDNFSQTIIMEILENNTILKGSFLENLKEGSLKEMSQELLNKDQQITTLKQKVDELIILNKQQQVDKEIITQSTSSENIKKRDNVIYHYGFTPKKSYPVFIGNLKEFNDSLSENIEKVINEENSYEVSSTILSVLIHRKSLILNEYIGHSIAKGISMLIDGKLPDYITLYDNQFDLEELLDQINNSTSRVIYIEGLLEFFNEVKFAHLSKNVNDKILIFGINSVETLNLSSDNIYHYAFYLDVMDFVIDKREEDYLSSNSDIIKLFADYTEADLLSTVMQNELLKDKALSQFEKRKIINIINSYNNFEFQKDKISKVMLKQLNLLKLKGEQ